MGDRDNPDSMFKFNVEHYVWKSTKKTFAASWNAMRRTGRRVSPNSPDGVLQLREELKAEARTAFVVPCHRLIDFPGDFLMILDLLHEYFSRNR